MVSYYRAHAEGAKFKATLLTEHDKQEHQYQIAPYSDNQNRLYILKTLVLSLSSVSLESNTIAYSTGGEPAAPGPNAATRYFNSQARH